MSKIIIGGHKVTAQADYSTTETKTGEYWIDGKPIYRRVITGTTASADMFDVAHNIGNFGELVNIYGYVELLGSFMPVGFFNGSTAWFDIFVDATSLRFRIASSYQNYPFKIILEYTKTTD